VKRRRRFHRPQKIPHSGNLGSCCAVLPLCETYDRGEHDTTRHGATGSVRKAAAAHITLCTTSCRARLSVCVPRVGILVLVVCSRCCWGPWTGTGVQGLPLSQGSCNVRTETLPACVSLAWMCVAVFCQVDRYLSIYCAYGIDGSLFFWVDRPTSASFCTSLFQRNHMYVWRYGDDLQWARIPTRRGEGTVGGMAGMQIHQPGHSAWEFLPVVCLELASLRDWFTVFLTFAISVFRLSSGRNGQSRREVRGKSKWRAALLRARTRAETR
jgi:hypothetical protein